MTIKTTTAIWMSWGLPVPGRERPALEEFNSYLQWANKLKAEGKIERFDVYQPRHGTPQSFSGFTLLEGSEEQIAMLERSQEWRTRVERVMLTVQNIQYDVCDAGEAVANRMKLFGSSVQQLAL